MVKKIGLFTIAIVFFAGCYNFYKHPEVRTTPNKSNKLRLDGYYYTLEEKSEALYSTILILYSNGCIYGFMGERINSHNFNFINSDNFIDTLSKFKLNSTKDNWAGYSITDSLITIKRVWGRIGETLYTYKGVILNDTTFIIKKIITEGSIQYSENGIDDVNEIYHFRSYSPKPDSTNNFIIIDE